jgi:hypothetical protein
MYQVLRNAGDGARFLWVANRGCCTSSCGAARSGAIRI